MFRYQQIGESNTSKEVALEERKEGGDAGTRGPTATPTGNDLSFSVLLRPTHVLSLAIFFLFFAAGCLYVRTLTFSGVVLGVYISGLSIVGALFECFAVQLPDGRDPIDVYFAFYRTVFGRGILLCFLSFTAMQISFLVGLLSLSLSLVFVAFASFNSQGGVPRPIYTQHGLAEFVDTSGEAIIFTDSQTGKAASASKNKSKSGAAPPSTFASTN